MLFHPYSRKPTSRKEPLDTNSTQPSKTMGVVLSSLDPPPPGKPPLYHRERPSYPIIATGNSIRTPEMTARKRLGAAVDQQKDRTHHRNGLPRRKTTANTARGRLGTAAAQHADEKGQSYKSRRNTAHPMQQQEHHGHRCEQRQDLGRQNTTRSTQQQSGRGNRQEQRQDLDRRNTAYPTPQQDRRGYRQEKRQDLGGGNTTHPFREQDRHDWHRRQSEPAKVRGGGTRYPGGNSEEISGFMKAMGGDGGVWRL